MKIPSMWPKRRRRGCGRSICLLAVEACGNVCVATLIAGCISLIAPDGTIVEQVPTGDRVTTNIAFGGPELKTAYITLSGKGELIAMDWARPRPPLNFLNK